MVATIRPAERQRSAELPEITLPLAGMPYSYTMQEPLLGRPKPVSALTPAGGRKEMTMTRATPGIVVGFAV